MKKIILIALAIVLCFSLCACSSLDELLKAPEFPTRKDQETSEPGQTEQTPPAQDDHGTETGTGESGENTQQEEQTEPATQPEKDPDGTATSPDTGKDNPPAQSGKDSTTRPGQSTQPHVHDFSLQVVSEKYAADEESTYYYSSSCGARGTETFYRNINISEDQSEPGYWGPIVPGKIF